MGRHVEQLRTAAEFLGATEGGLGHSLVVNLGPSSDQSIHELFEGNLIELPAYWHERPPGLGICPLDIIFSVCSSIHNWLKTSEKNVVVGGPEFSNFGILVLVGGVGWPWWYRAVV